MINFKQSICFGLDLCCLDTQIKKNRLVVPFVMAASLKSLCKAMHFVYVGTLPILLLPRLSCDFEIEICEVFECHLILLEKRILVPCMRF